MGKNVDFQIKLMEDFLRRHFKSQKIRYKTKWKRVIMGYDDNIYYVNNEQEKIKLRTHLKQLLGEVFGFKKEIISKTVSRFI